MVTDAMFDVFGFSIKMTICCYDDGVSKICHICFTALHDVCKRGRADRERTCCHMRLISIV